MNKTDNRPNTCFTAMHSRPALILFSLLSLLLLTMTGCFTSNSSPTTPVSTELSNGNGGADSKPETPVLRVKYTVKQLHFSWSAVAGASYYRILENPDGISGFSPISPTLSATSYTKEIKRRSSGWSNTRYQLEACNSSLKCSTSEEIDIKEFILSGIPPVTATKGGLSDYFGLSVTLSGDGTTLVVGAPGEDSSATGINGDETGDKQPQSGAAYVFMYGDGKWIQQAYLKASNNTQNSKFGYALALSNNGNTLVIGAPGGIGEKTEESGAVYIFTRSNNRWHQQALLSPTNAETGDRFGTSVALDRSGTTLAIGAPGKDSDTVGNNIVDSGAAYIWSLSDDVQWKQQQYINPNTVTRLGEFGKIVTISSDGATIAIGANKGSSTDNDSEGAIFIFSYRSEKNQWDNQQLIKAPIPEKNSFFGASMALSGNGNILAAGARQENSSKGEHTGTVYLFTRNSLGQWTIQRNLQASNAGPHDEFGSSLAFNEDGSLLAVGAPFEDGMAMGLNGDQTRDECCNSGSIYLFSFSDQRWKQVSYIKPTVNNNEKLFGEFGTSLTLSSDSSTLAVGAPHLASLLLLTGEILDTLAAPKGNGVVYLYSPPAML